MHLPSLSTILCVALTIPLPGMAQPSSRVDLECDVRMTKTETKDGKLQSETTEGSTTYSVDFANAIVTDSKGIRYQAEISDQHVKFSNASSKQPQLFTTTGVLNRVSGNIEETRTTAVALKIEVKISGTCEQKQRKF